MKFKALVRLILLTMAPLLSTEAHGQDFSVIHQFSGLDGSEPYSGVTIRDGVLYGTTFCWQFACSGGRVYQIQHVGSDWVYSTISELPAGGDGPTARVLFGPDGALYGTTFSGGSKGDGVVFNLTPPLWTETVLHGFAGSPDGDSPGYGDLIWDHSGNIYGTTVGGGTAHDLIHLGMGTVFEMTQLGNDWTETPIYFFGGPDGAYPESGVIFDNNGNLLGTTSQGGMYGYGTVFRLTYIDGIGWKQTVLYSFRNQSDGQYPIGSLIMDSTGNLYGTTNAGGSGTGGTVFELIPSGNTYTFKLLYSFPGTQTYFYCGPAASLSMDSTGNLYGTTTCDGAYGYGNVFKLTSTGDGWQYASLHDFTRYLDGGYPVSNVTFDSDGNLYGSAAIGGNPDIPCNQGCGTVWMIKP